MPLRPVGESYHYDVNWLAQQQHVNIADKRPVAAYIDEAKTVVVFTLGKTVYTKDGQEVTIDQALLLINDHLYIPVRHLSDAISWDEEAYAVYLGKGADEAAARTKAYQERLAKEKAEAEKAAREKAEAERLAKEQAARAKADYVEEHITQGPDRIIGNWKGYWMIEDRSTAKARHQFHVKKAADGDYYVVTCNYNRIDTANNRESTETSTQLWRAVYDADKDAYFFQLIKDDGNDYSNDNHAIWYLIEGDTLVQVGAPIGIWNLTVSELYRF